MRQRTCCCFVPDSPQLLVEFRRPELASLKLNALPIPPMLYDEDTMGNADSSSPAPELRQPSANVSKRPMPDGSEVETRFTKVLASMDLPPDKAKVLKNYQAEKKWALICDQEQVQPKESPRFYLQKLRTYLDPKASRSSRKRKMLGDSTSTQVLRDLEISLRTNHIEWVREFLNEENKGLDTLIDYLSFRQVYLRHEQIISRTLRNSLDHIASNGHAGGRKSILELDAPTMKKASKHIQKLNMGEAKDDIHVCIMSLRAIMNNKYGFNMVIEHREAINCIALSLNHKSLRTKALVLELLAAICLVRGGHQIILSAFDNFKEVCSESRRFETLMEYFMNYDTFQIEFMVACVQFINIIVHSVEDMNFRVHLQYEFTQLGLDDYLEKVKHTESEEFQVQISAYLDNVFDVSALMEDSETKLSALERVGDLEEQLSHAMEQIQEMENESLAKIVELETQLQDVITERDELRDLHHRINEEVNELKQAVSQREEESRHRQSLLETKIMELQTLQETLPRSATDGKEKLGSFPPAPPPLPSVPKAPPAPPAPPPPPGMRGPIFPPPPPEFMGSPGDAMTIKRRVQTKYKLPTLNWIALKPNQVKGTVFNELDDDRLYAIIDFNMFEEHFKIGNQGTAKGDDADNLHAFGSKRFKKPEMVTLLEHNRLRNMAISRRKLDMNVDVILKGIANLDLKMLCLENVEVLLRMVPSEQEMKSYREYERDKKPVSVLTDEDKFLLQLCKVERLSQKLNIMSYMGNFHENIQLITPQIHAVIAAARSIRHSKKIKRILEIILAFGNYLNSSKRGPAYGFKLQSLDVLLDTKSANKKMSLMHYIVDTVRHNFPDLMNFESELRFVEKASGVSLENIMTDVHELEKGMDLIKKEQQLKKEFKDNSVLKDFRAGNEDKLRKLQSDAKTAQDAFSDVVEYFGESSRTLAANTFFSLFLRFTRAFKQAEIDNENRRKLEAAAREVRESPPEEVNKKNKVNKKLQQDAVICELKSKSQLVKEKKLLKQDEVYNGALEDILLGLKNEPYRRADAVRRSQRRRQENVRLSRTMDEMNV